MANAAQNIDTQQAALLASIAQSGSAGAAAQAATSNQQQTEGAGAQQTADSRAGQINAPANFLAQSTQQIAAPYSQAAATAKAAASAYQQQIGGLSSINNNYFDEVKAALPIVQAQQQASVNQNQTDNSLKQLQDQYQVQQLQAQGTAQQQATQLAGQQKGIQDTVNSGTLSQDSKDTFNAIISGATSYADASSQLAKAAADPSVAKDPTKLAAIQALEPYVRSYYYPQYSPDPAQAAAAAQAAQQQAAASSPSNSTALLGQYGRQAYAPFIQGAQNIGNFLGSVGNAKNYIPKLP